MSIQYKVLGFEPTTFKIWVPSHNHLTKADALVLQVCTQLLDNILITTYFLFWSNPILLNVRPAVQWSFPLRWVYSDSDFYLDRPPSWRPLLSFVGFGVAVVWIYALANEIVALLKVFGVALGFSDAILGLTLLAWGNSISDLVADVAVARRGFPRMGFSASFGGPLFNLLLGIGLPFTVQFLKKGSNSVQVLKKDFLLPFAGTSFKLFSLTLSSITLW